ncbi:MAG: J domain-containing protein [Deltaproteobacteria bacterium]|nr:J domain-containing protein [Deltaproteobacteria bacterium]
MRLNLSHERLASDLRQLGTRFVLRAEAAADLARFDLGDDEQPIIDALRTGTSLPELEASDRTLDPRMIAAMLGALAACGAVTSIDPRTITPQDISLARSPTPREPTISRVPTPREPTSSSCVPMIIAHDPPVTRPIGSAPKRPATHPANVQFRRAEAVARVPSGRSLTDPFLEGQATTMRPAELSQMQIRELIRSRLALLEQGADHFTFLGVPFGAAVSDVREAYLELARYLRPEKLKELGIPDDRDEARTVFAQAVIAFTTLTDAVRRDEYLMSTRRRQGH